MKKNANIITGVIDLIVVISAFVFPTWDFAEGGYGNIYSWDWGSGSTIAAFSEITYYNDGFAKILMIASFICLVVSAFMMFSKKNIKIFRIIQAVASIVIPIVYFLYHISAFDHVADYAICELNGMGFLMVVVCVVNAVLTMMFVKEENSTKEEQECIVNNVEKA